jgi:metal-responsive CopG/Arc/MetJ family transcriptional regulator
MVETKQPRNRVPITITLSPRAVAMLDKEIEEHGGNRSREVERAIRVYVKQGP